MTYAAMGALLSVEQVCVRRVWTWLQQQASLPYLARETGGLSMVGGDHAARPGSFADSAGFPRSGNNNCGLCTATNRIVTRSIRSRVERERDGSLVIAGRAPSTGRIWLAPPSTGLYGQTFGLPSNAFHGVMGPRLTLRSMAVREFLRSNWQVVTIVVTAGAIVCAAVFLLSSMPPRSIAMATGPEGGGYYEIGRQYQELLARTGVELRLVATAGSMQNLALLRDPQSGVNIALVQGGSVGEAAGELESLGTVFYEPLWIFHRGGLEGATLAALRGRKVSIGPVGSGSHALLLKLLKRNDVDQDVGELLALPPQEAADKLLSGDIDAVGMLASWDAPVVQQLVADERVELLNLARADAYVALYPFLSKATVPRGVGDLAKDRPPADVTLFASKASLVVRKDLHAAIQYLLLSTAVQIHSGVSMFHRAGRFPAAEGLELPLSSQAVQFYKSGQPFLQHNLPFWIASLVGRLLVLLIPIVAVLYPLMRFLPASYGWLMRRKIARLYGAEISGGRDHKRRRTNRSCSADGAARST
jgi:TRAP transporter TAXI family solute receptor